MKKLISVLLCVSMIFCVASPAASALSGKCDCGYEPTIYVGPLGNSTIYENPDTEDERELYRPTAEMIIGIVADVLPAAICLAVTKDYDKFADRVCASLNGAMGALALDGDGNSAENVAVKPEIPDDPTHGPDSDYYFHYDWRLDPVEIAAQLDDFVQYIKELTGHDKVNFRASSMGGVVTMAYFNEYGYDDVDACIFQCCPILGTSLAGDLLTGKIAFSASALLDLGVGAYPPVDIESIMLDTLFYVLYYSGIIDSAMGLGTSLVDKLKDKLYSDFLTPVFGTVLGLWSFVPDESYELAKQMNLDPDTQAGLINKADYYHYQVQCRADEILRSAVNSGVRVMIVAGYNTQATPIIESMDDDTDSTVDTRFASAGATVADRKSTLPEGYTQAVDCGHNHISPDNRIDASTCILPENTWFIKDMLHSNSHDGIRAMYNWFTYSDEYYNVWSDPRYTQFLQNDKPNKRIIAMGNFADGAVVPEYAEGTSFHDKYEKYVAPIAAKVLSVLDYLKENCYI